MQEKKTISVDGALNESLSRGMPYQKVEGLGKVLNAEVRGGANPFNIHTPSYHGWCSFLCGPSETMLYPYPLELPKDEISPSLGMVYT